MRQVNFLLCCFVMIVSACQPSSRSAENQPHIKKTDSNRTCVPESELLSSNIIGGEVVQSTDVDSKAVVLLVSGGQLCTAAAIAPKVLLTAAHCIAGSKHNSYVSFYASVSCESGYNKNKYIKGIADTVVHENYNGSLKPEESDSDIALVILEDEIPAGYAIYKIADTDNSSSSDMLLYGYGRTSSKAGGAGILRKTTLGRSFYQVDTDKKKIKINQSHGTGICQGDSGGPALVDINGEFQILGINSYVVGPEDDVCSKESFQTLVSSYKDWINYKVLAYTGKSLD